MVKIIPSHHAEKQRDIGTEATNGQKRILAPSAEVSPSNIRKPHRPALQIYMQKCYHLATYESHINTRFMRS